ncbi:MAG: aminotransferase class III-fold pyridoxal phosphate-dependent enzyme, partial [Mesorhizobium sp.]
LFDRDGRAYIDASGGAAVSCLGHSHPDVTAALHAQADKLAYAHTSFFTNERAETLADKLVSGAPQGIRQFFVETGKPERRNVIARRQSYHGNTLGALAAGGNEWRRAQFRPLLINTYHIEPCYAYRYQEAGESEEAYGLRAAQALEDKILELGPDTVMAFVAEPVVGATA